MPPCGGHPGRSWNALTIWSVSSRAPVWGASGRGVLERDVADVSSRAPVWGASNPKYFNASSKLFQVVPPCGGHQLSVRSFMFLLSFKSCPRVGGIRSNPMKKIALKVSSRAPVWGASLV